MKKIKDFLVSHKDGITTGIGAAQFAVVSGYEAYQQYQGQPGNWIPIVLSVALGLKSYFIGK